MSDIKYRLFGKIGGETSLETRTLIPDSDWHVQPIQVEDLEMWLITGPEFPDFTLPERVAEEGSRHVN